MAYPNIDDPNFNEEILQRKEFYVFKTQKPELQKIPGSIEGPGKKQTGLMNKIIKTLAPVIDSKYEMEEGIRLHDFMHLHPYQEFIANFQNPNTEFTRLLIKWDPGLGKTIGALNVAMSFLDYYRHETEMGVDEVGSIFVLGFSRGVFKADLLRFPSFGFISHEEIKRFEQLRAQAEQGSSFDAERLHEFIVRINRRFSDRKHNGFFKFFGYKEFVNRIFIFSSMAKKRRSLHQMTEVEILEALKSGEMKFNQELIDSFKNSLIICDEVHNIYNSSEKNNWGTAIQAVLDSQPTARAVFLSATPIMNNPSECIDLANLLLPPSKRLSKKSFFNTNEELLPGALDKLASIFRGRVSYARNQNPKHFPARIMLGEKVPNISYLRFIRCPMSDFHANTYNKIFNGALAQDAQYLSDFCIPNPDYDTEKIGLFQTEVIKQKLRKASQRWKDQNKIDYTDDLITGDFLQLPGLSKFSTKYATAMKDIIYLLKHNQGKMLVYHNSVHMSGVLFIQEMLKYNGFIDETSSPNENTLCQICGHEKRMHKKGTAIAVIKPMISPGLEDESIGGGLITKISDNDGSDSDSGDERYAGGRHNRNIAMQDEHKSYSIKNRYYDDVQIPEDSLITKLDQGGTYYTGGINLEGSEPQWIYQNINEKQIEKEMTDKFNSPHEFTPARFAMAHSCIDQNQTKKSIDAFNTPSNTEGRRYCIMVGSRKIRESYDFKAIRNLLVLGKPDNIPILIQIIGRAIRSGSHSLLPPDQRKVFIRIYTSCLPEKTIVVDENGIKHNIYKMSYEEERYKEKIKSYLTIQKIEKVMHENAIDAITNRPIIFSKEETAQREKLKSQLGTLWFEPELDEKKFENLSLQQLNTDTFDVYYAKNEVNLVVMLIKRLFIESQTVWAYAQLFDAVKNPPSDWDIPYNCNLISEQNFQIALNKLIWTNKQEYIKKDSDSIKLNDNKNKYIEPIIENEYSEFEPYNRLMNPDDKLITLLNGQRSIIAPIGKYYILFPISTNGSEIKTPVIDIEMPYRNIISEHGVFIDVMQYLEERPVLQDYATKKSRFKTKYLGRTIEDMQGAICDYGADFHQALLEESILYAFQLWTTGFIPKPPKNEKDESLHDFYFKMLSYYDLIGLVIWASGAKKSVLDRYRTFVTKPIKLYKLDLAKISDSKNDMEKLGIAVDNDPVSTESDSSDSENELNKSDIVRILKSTIKKSRCDWLPVEQKRKFYKSLTATIELSHSGAKTFAKKGVPANILPIGHFMKKIPRFYHPESGWFEIPDYVSNTIIRWKENSIIVGYDEKSRTGVHVRFKIRNPIQNIKQFKDTRKIEKGSVCSSKSKEFLFDIARQLKIDIPAKLNVGTLCDIIRARLIRNEIEERKKPDSNIKWFYHYFDNTRPETLIDADDKGE